MVGQEGLLSKLERHHKELLVKLELPHKEDLVLQLPNKGGKAGGEFSHLVQTCGEC